MSLKDSLTDLYVYSWLVSNKYQGHKIQWIDLLKNFPPYTRYGTYSYGRDILKVKYKLIGDVDVDWNVIKIFIKSWPDGIEGENEIVDITDIKSRFINISKYIGNLDKYTVKMYDAQDKSRILLFYSLNPNYACIKIIVTCE